MTHFAMLSRVLCWTSWAASVGLWLAAALVKWVGPIVAIVAPLAYLPKVLPAFGFLLPIAMGWLCRSRWLVVVGVASVLAWLGPALEWRMTGSRQALDGPILRVMTCNRGQNNGHTLSHWISLKNPDMLVFQDAYFPGAYVAKAPEYRDYPHVRRIAEHVLISRHPILSAAQASREPITRRGSEWWYQPGVRFVVDFEGREVVIWSVHLRSPRDHFRQLRGAFLWTLGWNRPGEPFPGLARGDLETYWIEHRKTVEALKELMEAETLPTLVLGDWNVPDVGPLYQRVSAGFSDAHREAGAGYGYTFPGDLEWWAAFGQPWLRIDYVLSDRHWRPRRCEVEPASGGAQHLALFAELELQ